MPVGTGVHSATEHPTDAGWMERPLDLQMPVQICQFRLQPRGMALGHVLTLSSIPVTPSAKLGDGCHQVATRGG